MGWNLSLAMTPLLLTVLFASSQSGFEMTPAQYWHPPFGTDQRTPSVGDLDRDGHADLISFWPVGDGVIDIARTSALGKPLPGGVARRGFGRDGIGVACGAFVRNSGEVAGFFADGSVRVAWAMEKGGNEFTRDDLAAQIPPGLIPKAQAKTAVADFDADGRLDILVIDAEGRLLLFQNKRGTDGIPKFLVRPVKSQLPDIRQFSAGTLAGEAKGQFVWLDVRGGVYRSTLTLPASGPVEFAPKLVMQASPDDHLAVGRFRGLKTADVLVGQTLLAGGDPKAKRTMSEIPALEVAKDDGVWAVGDVDGNGKDDLVRFRRGRERFWGGETFVHFAYAPGEDKGYFCSSNDGLLDVWKQGKMKPGGLDLQALGCKVGQRDAIVEIERFENVDETALRANVDRAIKYYASLGIALHPIYRKPWPNSEHDKIMPRFDEYFPPVEHRGIVHTMFAENHGPGVAKVKGDNGHFEGSWAVFLHEFGHQLDLGHEGFWLASYCALYPSLMSYSYSYSLGDNGEAIGYSDGSLSSFHIDEQHLSERLPFPYEKVKFLAGGPYRFRVKPSADGKEALVDWNWNGVFGEEDVQADINYSHGTEFGPHYEVGKTRFAPVVVTTGDHANPRLLLMYETDSRLAMRVWQGANRDTEGDRWSAETSVVDAAVTGDLSATVFEGRTWVAYPTAKGVVLRSIEITTDGKARPGPASIITQSVGAQPTLAALEGRLALLLWRSPSVPVGLRFLRAGANQLLPQAEASLDIQSQVPVGAVGGAKTATGTTLWVARTETAGKAKTNATEILRYELGTSQLKVVERQWMNDVYATRRCVLQWRPEAGMEPQGRLYHFGGGASAPGQPSPHTITMNVPYPDYNAGWLARRYYQPDFVTASAAGACFWQGNIVYAYREANDKVSVAFYGSGAAKTPMGDFDDISHVRDYGLSRSISFVSK